MRICSLYTCKPDLYNLPADMSSSEVDKKNPDARAGGIEGELTCGRP